MRPMLHGMAPAQWKNILYLSQNSLISLCSQYPFQYGSSSHNPFYHIIWKSFSVKTYHFPPLYFTEYSLHIQLLMATRLFSEDTLYRSIPVNLLIFPHALHSRAIKLGEGQEVLHFSEQHQTSSLWMSHGHSNSPDCALPLKYKWVFIILLKFFNGPLCLEDETQVP